MSRRQYPFHRIEPKWQRQWAAQQTYRAWNPGDSIPESHPFGIRHRLGGQSPTAESLPPKYYILDMFPYPSGAGLHVGHPEGYTATDILARYRRSLGFNVLHPMGWDAFGLPAEQYAVRTGQHPRITTEQNIANFTRQIQSLGFSYDWSREVNTTDPDYCRWTQWIFLQIYNSWFNPATRRAEPISSITYPQGVASKAQRRTYCDSQRLAFISEAPVNWCPELGTVLSNEEVIDGKSEVGGHPVVRKPMRQWKLRITAFAERLLEDLNTIEWSDSLKEMQRNWIGRSEGAEVDFRLVGHSEKVRVFTTRPDTLFGATYMVLAPEHRLVEQITTAAQRAAVQAYQTEVTRKSDLERTELAKEKSGVWTGAYALNPVNNAEIPVWIADYVLATYGTGAIMAVPAHDERDLEFAQKFDLPIIQVVQPPDSKTQWQGFCDEGTAIHSNSAEIHLDGLLTRAAKQKITDWLESSGRGARTINYKLRDWLFSRQRYWGEPFPLVWKKDDDGTLYHEALELHQLPLLPPQLDDYKPTADGQPPLARAIDWLTLPDGSLRETNTMPQWAGSCWYYLRYLDNNNNTGFVGHPAESYWMGTAQNSPATPGVDLYVGGTEHAVLHLLYARFWHKVLFDLGHVSTSEPFFKLVNQGLIQGEDGQKMSKSRGNVVNPDDVLVEYGADAFRLYEMFMGPLQDTKPWNTKGVEGVYRFLGRVWRLFIDETSETAFEQLEALAPQQDRSEELLQKLHLSKAIQAVSATPAQLKTLHECIRKVTYDLDHLQFNTAISAMMVFVNSAITWEVKPVSVLQTFLQLLAPFAPHIVEELWGRLEIFSPPTSLSYAPWPQFDPTLLIETEMELPVQVNGKLRDVIRISVDASQADIEKAALIAEKALPFLEGKTIRKLIVVPRKMVNIVVA